MPSHNPYKNLNLDRDLLLQSVEDYGGKNVKYERAGSAFHLTCQLQGAPFRMAVYENKNGTTTLSFLPPAEKIVFEGLADHISVSCKSGDGGRFDFSTQKFPATHVDLLLEYLQEDAEISEQRVENTYRLTKLKGRLGDSLTVKVYGNGTLQLQGRRAMLAAQAQDYLTNVLPYADAVKAQMATFAVPIKLEVVEDETAGRLPHAASRLDSKVSAQLTSAMALTKVNIELADYGAVAFPALRGLEGFIKSELTRGGLRVLGANSLGEYFTSAAIVGQYEMHAPVAALLGEPRASSLVDCYTLYARERHGIAHMDPDPATSRVVESLDAAQRIVFAVLDTIDRFCRKLPL